MTVTYFCTMKSIFYLVRQPGKTSQLSNCQRSLRRIRFLFELLIKKWQRPYLVGTQSYSLESSMVAKVALDSSRFQRFCPCLEVFSLGERLFCPKVSTLQSKQTADGHCSVPICLLSSWEEVECCY